jgi:hypothetical protein
MFYATFNVWSFTTLLLKAEGSRVSLFMPLSILFQSFTTLRYRQGVEEAHVLCHFQ